jgi:2,3-bisphosphoglycerate-independent phosphoglycerate mutase
MVGHTGVPSAIIKACETVDACLKEVIEKGMAAGYSFIIIADHGNADIMYNEDGSPHTAHSVNLVPVVIINKEVEKVSNGSLADIAPTVLHLLKIKKPIEMTGNSLVSLPN